MKKKGNSHFGHDFWCAFNIIMSKDVFVSIDDNTNVNEEGEVIDIHDALEFEVYLKRDALNPEQQMILKEAFEMLSKESKEAVFIITFWPDKLVKSIGPETLVGLPALKKRRLLKYLGEKGYSVDRIMEELKAFSEVYFSVKP